MTKYTIYLKGSIFEQVKLIGTYKVKKGFIHIKWDEVLHKDFVYKPTKLLGFIPWQKQSLGWVNAALPTTPNPYIIPVDSVSLIAEVK